MRQAFLPASDTYAAARTIVRLGRNIGFARGLIFTEDGILVASVAQEGVLRRRRPMA